MSGEVLYDKDCQYCKKQPEFEQAARGGELKELHVCKNKRCVWVFCETAFRLKQCPEQEVLPV